MAIPSIPAMASTLTAKVTSDLIKTPEATPKDKANWKPIGAFGVVGRNKVRSILSQDFPNAAAAFRQ